MIEVKRTGDAYDVYDGDYRVATCQTAGQAERIKRALEREDMTVISFEATREQDMVIEDTLGDADWKFFGEVGSAKSTADTLVAVLEDWRKRVKDEDETKKNEDAGKRTQIHLRLDSDDHRYIMAAVERRKAWDCEPDSDSCELGTMIAEICRGWMERVEHDTQGKPRRTDNGDGTTTVEIPVRMPTKWFVENRDIKSMTLSDGPPEKVKNGDGTITFDCVPVTVREDVLEGRDVLAVRSPNEGEEYVSAEDGKVHCSWDGGGSVSLIVGPKPQPQPPQFRDGGFYRRRNGKLAGPLVRRVAGPYSWKSDDVGGHWNHYENGRVYADREADADLMPGEVVVWRHPASMPADAWEWRGEFICKGEEPYIWRREAIVRVWSDWTDPPRVGKWLVREGQEYATWEGE